MTSRELMPDGGGKKRICGSRIASDGKRRSFPPAVTNKKKGEEGSCRHRECLEKQALHTKHRGGEIAR